MKGIQFVIDDQGQKTAVVIDLKQWGKVWEEFYQILLTHISNNEEWLHQSPLQEKLDQALEWNANHPPQVSDLAALEIQLKNYE
ncbi:hypothetical protein [Gloeothece verrucosa]|uniref:Uncharacterized protein n=1 Tax=Gloeothece verrucosa (strain PCC 7822) TaxID=497965 RepID=E0UKE7_GLOV7|nr:hypothetical protein [Gloeothece verrucosa]ADN17028.1 conserved hypothetical protein [Gloeothece verrucosa PCC 7822]